MLGKTERTIRRWVESGKIEVNRDVTPYEVNVGPFADELRTPADERLQERIDELEADNARLTDTIEELETDNERLKADRERLTSTIEELRGHLQDARNEREDWKDALAMSLSNQQQLLESGAGRPWWRRLWPWGGDEED